VCSLQVPLFATVVFIGTMLFALQQLSGINSVFYFSSTVFRSVGVSASLANICMGVSNLSGEFCAFEILSYYAVRCAQSSYNCAVTCI
jgi:hypothetical protein